MYKIVDNDVGAWRVVSDDMWNGFKFGVPGLYYAYDNDFFQYAAGDWTITAVGGAATQALTDAVGGRLLLTNGAADNDLISMQLGAEAFMPAVGKKIFFETSFQVNDATQTDWLMGLVVTDTSPLTTTNGIFFRKDDGTTSIGAIVCRAGVESIETGLAINANATDVKVGFVVNGTSTTDFYVNGVYAATITGNVPTTEMRVTMHIQDGEAVAKSMSVNYVRCYEEI